MTSTDPGKMKDWLDAAEKLEADPAARIRCPSCHQGFLEVVESGDGSSYRERILRCTRCGSWNSILKGVPRTGRASGS